VLAEAKSAEGFVSSTLEHASKCFSPGKAATSSKFHFFGGISGSLYFAGAALPSGRAPRRQAEGGTPISRLKARLKAASDS
jgi:hypothetical protein